MVRQTISPWYVIRQVGSLGFIIALPLAGLVYLGHALDVRLGYRAVFIFVGMLLALILSGWLIYQKIKNL